MAKTPVTQKSTGVKAPVQTSVSLDASSKRDNLIYLILLCIVFLFSYSYIFDKKADLNGDNFGYLNYAKAILDGKGYVSPYTPNYTPTNWFPPGYSAFLALLMAVFGQNSVLFNAVNGFLYLGAMLLLFSIAKKVTQNKPLAFTVVVLLFLNSGLMRYATIVMSEIPYLFLSTVAIYSLSGLDDSAKFWKNRWFWGIVLGAVGAFYFRSVALGLVAAIVLYFVFQKKWKQAGVFILSFGLLYLPWFIRDHVHGLKSRYFDTMTVANAWRPEEGHIQTVGAFLEKMAVNFNDTVIKGFTEVTFPFVNVAETEAGLMWTVGILIVVITFFGAWKTGKYKLFFTGYLLANIGVFLLWHSGNGSRYVWPLAPFIVLCFFNGLYYLLNLVVQKVKLPSSKNFAFGFLIVSFLLMPKMKELNQMAKSDYLPAYKNYFEIAKALKKNGNPSLMISCRKTEMFHYFSGTYVTSYEFSLDDAKILSTMVRDKVDYVVLEQLGYGSTFRYLYPAIIKHQNLFRPVMQLPNPDTYLLEFDKQGAKQYLDSLNAAGSAVPES
jgi:hypothetical protein